MTTNKSRAWRTFALRTINKLVTFVYLEYDYMYYMYYMYFMNRE